MTSRPIHEAGFSAPLRLLMLAPHPDDFDAIGVTFKYFFGLGNLVEVAVVRGGSGVEDAYRPGLTLDGKARVREQEQRNSLRFFGLPESGLTFLSLANGPDDQMLDTPGNRATVRQFMLEKAPDVVLCPHGNDTNTAHRAMCAIVEEIAAGMGRPLTVLLNRDVKTIALRTDLYMPFSQETAVWKAELLRFHDTQHQRNLHSRGKGFDDRVLDLNRQIARELAIQEPYAEAFELRRYARGPSP